MKDTKVAVRHLRTGGDPGREQWEGTRWLPEPVGENRVTGKRKVVVLAVQGSNLLAKMRGELTALYSKNESASIF